MRLRDTNPEFVAAGKALLLFGYPYDIQARTREVAHLTKKEPRKAAGGQRTGTASSTNDIETCLPIAWRWPDTSIPAFHWVSSVDSFLFAFEPQILIAKKGDMACTSRCRNKVLAALHSKKRERLPARSPATRHSFANARWNPKKGRRVHEI